MSLLLFHQGNVPIIEDGIIIEDGKKLAKLPLPTNNGGGWTTNVLSTAELITIYNQAKNGRIDGIMIIDSPEYGGLSEQKAISTGFRFNNSVVQFTFNHSSSEGFFNYDQTRPIFTVSISSEGILFII